MNSVGKNTALLIGGSMTNFYSRNLLGREAARLADQITDVARSSFERTNERFKLVDTPAAVRVTLSSGRKIEIDRPDRVTLFSQDERLERSFEYRPAELLWDAAAIRVREFRGQLESELATRMADVAVNPSKLSWRVVNLSGEFRRFPENGLITGLAPQSKMFEARHNGLALYLYENTERPLGQKSWHFSGYIEDNLIRASHSESGCRVTAMATEVLDGGR